MVKREYYKILEVSTDASQEEIKESYSKLSLERHPDKGGSRRNLEKLAKLMRF